MPLRSMKESSCFLARLRAWTASVRARQRSRMASSIGEGMWMASSSPARSRRASFVASFLSVLTLSPDLVGILDGAMTMQS